MSAIICRHVLAFTRPLTIALQAKECDVYKAYKMAQRLVTSLENERDSDMFKELWQVILKISDDLGIEPSRKRSVRRQQNRTNPPVTDTESYYRVAYYFAFLDHTLSHLKTRFPPELEGALLATFCQETYTTFRRRPQLTSKPNMLIIFLTNLALKVKWLRGKSK